MRPFSHRPLPPLALLVLGAFAVIPAAAQNDGITVALSASPNPSTTGSYTVSGSLEGARQASFTSYRLREVASSDPIIYYGITDPASFSFAVSGKAIGTYTYRAQRCFFTPGSSAPPRCENLGDALDVRVVAPDLQPSFGSATVSSQSWTQNQAIDAFTVPAATGGDGTLSYSATGLPAGVTMSSARQVSGTPSTAGSGHCHRQRRRRRHRLPHHWTPRRRHDVVDADRSPARPPPPAPAQRLPHLQLDRGRGRPPRSDRQRVHPKLETEPGHRRALPAATGGDYSATGLPAGVTMSSSRQVSPPPQLDRGRGPDPLVRIRQRVHPKLETHRRAHRPGRHGRRRHAELLRHRTPRRRHDVFIPTGLRYAHHRRLRHSHCHRQRRRWRYRLPLLQPGPWPRT